MLLNINAIIIAFCLLLTFAKAEKSNAPLVPLWSLPTLVATRELVRKGDPTVMPALNRLRKEADLSLAGPPVAVTDKPALSKLMPSKDPHDYISVSIYFWPDENDPLAPWIKRDGVANREAMDKHDNPRLNSMVKRVVNGTLTWWFTGESHYSDAAVEQLRTWFIHPATRMNPHFEYAQYIPNVNGGRGNAHGLIDSRVFIEMLSAVALLEEGDKLAQEDRRALRSWFRQYLDWLTTSDLGREESQAKNNHAIYYDAQTLAFALYIGDQERARNIIEQVGPQRVAKQIEPDGSLPLELSRPIAATYSAFTMQAYAQMAIMAHHAQLGNRMWLWKADDGRSIPQAVKWFIPYMEGKPWTYGETSDRFDTLRVCRFFRLFALATGDELCHRYAKLAPPPANDRMQLLYPLR